MTDNSGTENGKQENMQQDPQNAEHPQSEEKKVSDQPSEASGDEIINFEEWVKDRPEVALEQARSEIDELKKTVQRTQADFMNFKRRTEEERDRIKSLANESIVLEFLNVIDNFDRALGHEKVESEAFLEGLVLIRKQILDILGKYDVKEIPTDQGFDPHFHYAVMQEEAEEPGLVLEVLQKGYTMKDKVIRPSMVKVSK